MLLSISCKVEQHIQLCYSIVTCCSFYSATEGHFVRAVSKAKYGLQGYDFFTPTRGGKIYINMYFSAYTPKEFTFKGIPKEKKQEGDILCTEGQCGKKGKNP